MKIQIPQDTIISVLDFFEQKEFWQLEIDSLEDLGDNVTSLDSNGMVSINYHSGTDGCNATFELYKNGVFRKYALYDPGSMQEFHAVQSRENFLLCKDRFLGLMYHYLKPKKRKK